MSKGYAKIFESVLDSSIWVEPPETRILWITLLVMADRTGEVFASIPGLARRAHIPLKACEDALQTLLSPDQYSKTKDQEGRRLEEIEGGWRIINHAVYRMQLSKEDRRAYQAQWARDKRRKAKEARELKEAVEAIKADDEGVDSTSTNVNDFDTVQSTEYKGSTEKEGGEDNEPVAHVPGMEYFIPSLEEVVKAFQWEGCKPEWVARDWFDKMEAVGWRQNNMPIRNWRALVRRQISFWRADGCPKSMEEKFDRRRNGGAATPPRQIEP